MPLHVGLCVCDIWEWYVLTHISLFLLHIHMSREKASCSHIVLHIPFFFMPNNVYIFFALGRQCHRWSHMPDAMRIDLNTFIHLCSNEKWKWWWKKWCKYKCKMKCWRWQRLVSHAKVVQFFSSTSIRQFVSSFFFSRLFFLHSLTLDWCEKNEFNAVKKKSKSHEQQWKLGTQFDCRNVIWGSVFFSYIYCRKKSVLSTTFDFYWMRDDCNWSYWYCSPAFCFIWMQSKKKTLSRKSAKSNLDKYWDDSHFLLPLCISSIYASYIKRCSFHLNKNIHKSKNSTSVID